MGTQVKMQVFWEEHKHFFLNEALRAGRRAVKLVELLPDFNQMIAAVGHQRGFIRDSNLQAIHRIPGECSNSPRPTLPKNASTELYGSKAWLHACWLWGLFLSLFLLWLVILKARLAVELRPRFLGREKESHSALTRAGSPRNLCKSPLAWKTYGPSTKELSWFIHNVQSDILHHFGVRY